MYSSEALVRYKVNSDGRTAYEVMTGHRCKVQAIAFGEAVQFMFTVDKGDRHKAEPEWANGIFVGTISTSNAFFIVNKDGLFQCSRVNVQTATTTTQSASSTLLPEFTNT